MPVGLQQQQQQQPPQHTQYRQQPTGARLKVMRCVQLKAPESKRALIDFGLGVGVDLDRQVRMLNSTIFCQLKRRNSASQPFCHHWHWFEAGVTLTPGLACLPACLPASCGVS
jgi:hypothetical protein